MLNRREKDAEELELESCFSELRSKAAGGKEHEIESMANESVADLKEMQEMQQLARGSSQSFYKPSIPKPESKLSTPSQKRRSSKVAVAPKSAADPASATKASTMI